MEWWKQGVAMAALGLVFAALPAEAGANEGEQITEQERAQRDAWKAYQRNAGEQLAKGASARERLLAALLLEDHFVEPGEQRDPRIPALIDDALRMGREDVDILWAVAIGAVQARPEQRVQAIERLQASQGHNAAVWFLTAMPRAAFTPDALRQAAAAEHFDISYGQAAGWQFDLLRRLSPPTPARALEMELPVDDAQDVAAAALAMQIAMISPLLPFQGFTQLCAPESVSGAVLDDCQRLAWRMARQPDTMITAMMGLRVAERLEHDAERLAEIKQLRRVYAWQASQAGKLMNQAMDAKQIHQYLLHLVTEAPGTEMTIWQRELDRAGIPLNPPDDWVSPRERIHRDQAASQSAKP